MLWHICDSVATYLEHGVIHEKNQRCLGLLQYQEASPRYKEKDRFISGDALTM